MIQEERLLLWEVTVLIFFRGKKKVHMNICISEWLLRYRCLNLSFESVRFLYVVLDEELILHKKGGYKRQIACWRSLWLPPIFHILQI